MSSTFDFLRAEREKARKERDNANDQHDYYYWSTKVDVITDLIDEYLSQAIEEFNEEHPKPL